MNQLNVKKIELNKGKEKEIFNDILLGKHPDTEEELVVFQKMLKNVDELVANAVANSWL